MILNARRVQLPGSDTKTVLIAFEDVTERRESERALKESEAKYRTLIDSALDYAIFMVDTKGCVTSWSKGAEQILGYQSEDIIGKNCSKFYTENARQEGAPLAEIQKTIKDGRSEVEENRVRRDGSLFCANVITSAIVDSNDKLIGLIKIMRDVTKRKESERALKESEEKYRTLVTSAYDGIMVVRQDSSIEFANVNIEKMFGYDSGELINLPYDILIAKSDRHKHSVHHDHFMEQPKQRPMGQGLNLVGRRKDGSLFPIDISLSPFKSNSEIYINCVVRDITNEKLIEERRKSLIIQEKALRVEAIKSNRNKDAFLATLSHE
ncbi:MAG: PAS domain S-box protein, partial [Bdellovibrionales bacterium]